jgi:energy-coupling factor transport system permease protein
MDSRGYGRRTQQPAGVRRASAAALLLGLGGALVGTYQVISGGDRHGLGVALLVAGPVVALVGGLAAGRRGRRTRYRPDAWRAAEWAVVACGAVVVLGYAFGAAGTPATGVPLAWPKLELVPFLATLVAALPAFVTPPVPGAVAVRPALAVAA